MAKRLSDDAAIGHNQPGPNEFAEHWSAIRAAKRTLEEAQGIYRSKLKLAKDAGFNPSVITELLRLQKQDPDALEQHNRELARLAAWANIPVGTQTSLFGADDEQRPSESAAAAIRSVDVQQAGYDAALRGDPSDSSPHPPGTPHAVTWRQGYDLGRDFMERSGKFNEKVATPRKRKGRARASASAVAASESAQAPVF